MCCDPTENPVHPPWPGAGAEAEEVCVHPCRMRLRSVPPPAMWKDAQGAWWTSAVPRPWLARSGS